MLDDLERFDEQLKAEVPFGRSRVLALLSAGILGVLMHLLLPKAVRATHQASQVCDYYSQCDCCLAGKCYDNPSCAVPKPTHALTYPHSVVPPRIRSSVGTTV